MLSVSTSTMLTVRVKSGQWLERREGTWKLPSRTTPTTLRLQQRDSVFMAQSDFQLGDFLDTDQLSRMTPGTLSNSQPSAGAPHDPGWYEVDRPIRKLTSKKRWIRSPGVTPLHASPVSPLSELSDDPFAPSQPPAEAEGVMSDEDMLDEDMLEIEMECEPVAFAYG